MSEEQCAVGKPHIADLQGGVSARKEIGRIEEDPQVEEHERARALSREVGHSGNQSAAPAQGERQGPSGQPPRAPIQDARDRVSVGHDRQQSRLVLVGGVRQDDRQRGQRGTGSEQPRQHLGDKARLEVCACYVSAERPLRRSPTRNILHFQDIGRWPVIHETIRMRGTRPWLRRLRMRGTHT